MAFLFGDTFDHYATADITQKWTQIYTAGGNQDPTIAAVGRNSTNGLRANGGSVRATALTLTTSGATAILQFGFRSVTAFGDLAAATEGNPASTTFNAQLVFIRQGGTTQVWFRVNTNGTISAYNGTTLLGTTTVSLQQNVYAYIQIKVVIHSSTGTVHLRINGTERLALTGQNTQATGSATWDEIAFMKPCSSTTAPDWNMDDLMVMDGSGSAYNDFVDDHQGLYVPADGEGAHTDGTPSSGADRAEMVDEASADGDTTYNTKDTASQRDSFTLSTWPSSGGIGPIQIVAQARKEDAGGANIELGVRVSSTDHDGTAQGLNTSYAFYREVFEENPQTTAAWAAGAAPELIDHKET